MNTAFTLLLAPVKSSSPAACGGGVVLPSGDPVCTEEHTHDDDF